jgi:mannose-1-phosphate guanylyltransferase
MTSPALISVILAGGKGERFWPLSRLDRPKQFLSLDGSGRSLLQATADRLLAMTEDWQTVWVVTSAHLAEGVREQLPDLPEENLLLEPEGKDTAPAVAWSTVEIAKRFGRDAVVGFFPADPWIGDEAAFRSTLKAAAELAAQEDAIVTLGISPTFPSTGYGYIQQGQSAGKYGEFPAYHVQRFTEKPDRATAEQFLSTGDFSWNSGMFIFRAGVTLDELQTHAPEIMEPIADKGVAAYADLPKKSIDYALMEKTQNAYVLPAAFGWDDLGDWNAIDRLLKTDQANVELTNHIGLDTQGTLFYGTNPDELIVTIGLEDLVIVRDGNATLIVRKDRTQDIKQVLKDIQAHPQFKTLL